MRRKASHVSIHSRGHASCLFESICGICFAPRVPDMKVAVASPGTARGMIDGKVPAAADRQGVRVPVHRDNAPRRFGSPWHTGFLPDVARFPNLPFSVTRRT